MVLDNSYNDEGIWNWNEHGSDWIYEVRVAHASCCVFADIHAARPTGVR